MFQCNLLTDFSVYQEETVQKQSAFLSPPPQVSQLGSLCTGNSHLYASPKGTAISDKCKETVAILHYSFWQFSLKPTFLPLISILQGNYKERRMFHCGKREAERTGIAGSVLPHLDVSCIGAPGTAH